MGIFMYEEYDVPLLGKIYSITYPQPNLAYFTRDCPLEDLKKEDTCKVETFSPRGDLISKDENSETYETDRISIWQKANSFLKVDTSVFKLVEADLGSKLYITDVGFPARRRLQSNFYYHVQNPEEFPIQAASNDHIHFVGIYAVRVEMNWFSKSRIVDRVGYLEDGIKAIRNINDRALTEQFCGMGEVNIENCSRYSMEQIYKSLNPPYHLVK
nr:hypothetical protein [Leptospira ellisii]